MLFYYKLSAANAASKLLRVQNDLAGLLPVNRTAAFGTGDFIVLMVRSCSLFKAFFLFGSSTLYMILRISPVYFFCQRFPLSRML